MKRKTIMPIVITGLVLLTVAGLGQSVHAISQVHAQTPSVSKVAPVDTDKETQDDAIGNTSVQNQAVGQKDDQIENDKADNSTAPEVEDGN